MMFSASAASAPGKVILFGEHAVVSGATAVATSLSDLRVEAHVHPLQGNPGVEIVLGFLDGNEEGYASSLKWTLGQIHGAMRSGNALSWSPNPLCPEPPPEGLIDALEKLCELHPERAHAAYVPALFLASALIPSLQPSTALPDIPVGMRLVCPQSPIPVGAGLGSSAAYSVSVAGALVCARLGLNQASGSDRKPEDSFVKPTPAATVAINGWAFEAEKIIHGKPSGIDNTVSTFGGTVQYRKSPSGNVVQFFNAPAAFRLQLLIVNTKVPRSTRDLVAKVQNEFHSTDASRSVRMKGIFNAVDNVSRSYIKAIEDAAASCDKDDPLAVARAERALIDQMEALVDVNQQLLCNMGVSHEAIDRVCEMSARRGLHSKLTGAGGGGCVITVLPRNSNVDGEALASAFERDLANEKVTKGCESIRSRLGGDGVIFIAPRVPSLP